MIKGFVNRRKKLYANSTHRINSADFRVSVTRVPHTNSNYPRRSLALLECLRNPRPQSIVDKTKELGQEQQSNLKMSSITFTKYKATVTSRIRAACENADEGPHISLV